MFFPNRTNVRDHLYNKECEFKKYSTYYQTTNNYISNKLSSFNTTISLSKGKKSSGLSRGKNKTVCLFKHNKLYQNPKKRAHYLSTVNTDPSYEIIPQNVIVRRYSNDINNLLEYKKEQHHEIISSDNMINNESYQNFMNIIDNSHQLKSFANDILNYVCLSSNESSELKKENKLKTKPTSNNNYFDIILNKVIRKITLYSDTNNEITDDYVMNLLISEAFELKNETDKSMKQFYYIKNFSSYVETEKRNYSILQYLPLINAKRQLTKNEIIALNKNTEALLEEKKKKNSEYILRSKLGRIDEGPKRKRTRKVRKVGPNGMIYYVEEEITDTNEESSNNDEDGAYDIIGGGKGSIWDTYNKVQNKKKGILKTNSNNNTTRDNPNNTMSNNTEQPPKHNNTISSNKENSYTIGETIIQ